MDIWDSLCENVICPVGGIVGSAIEGAGSCIDTVVTKVLIDGVAGGIDSAVDFVAENPGKSAAIAAVTVATGGVALAAAGPIAAAAGGVGLLGTTSTGTVISTLSGAALTNASLAALGGGAVAAGGAGIAGGTAVVATAGAVTGAAVSGGVVAVTKSQG